MLATACRKKDEDLDGAAAELASKPACAMQFLPRLWIFNKCGRIFDGFISRFSRNKCFLPSAGVFFSTDCSESPDILGFRLRREIPPVFTGQNLPTLIVLENVGRFHFLEYEKTPVTCDFVYRRENRKLISRINHCVVQTISRWFIVSVP